MMAEWDVRAEETYTDSRGAYPRQRPELGTWLSLTASMMIISWRRRSVDWSRGH